MKAKGEILLISPGRKETINVNNHQRQRRAKEKSDEMTRRISLPQGIEKEFKKSILFDWAAGNGGWFL